MIKLVMTPLGLSGGDQVRLNEVGLISVALGGFCPVGAMLK